MNLVTKTLVIAIVLSAMSSGSSAQVGASRAAARIPTLHKTVQIDGLDIFYREAGPKEAPTILLLHGFPTSSHMFRNLIPALSAMQQENGRCVLWACLAIEDVQAVNLNGLVQCLWPCRCTARSGLRN